MLQLLSDPPEIELPRHISDNNARHMAFEILSLYSAVTRFEISAREKSEKPDVHYCDQEYQEYKAERA